MENTHYDPLYSKKRKMLPIIIRQELTEKQRQVILLYYVKKQTDQQIALALGIAPASAQKTRRRAEQRIAHYLSYCL